MLARILIYGRAVAHNFAFITPQFVPYARSSKHSTTLAKKVRWGGVLRGGEIGYLKEKRVFHILFLMFLKKNSFLEILKIFKNWNPFSLFIYLFLWANATRGKNLIFSLFDENFLFTSQKYVKSP